jgi:hypothetical protein
MSICTDLPRRLTAVAACVAFSLALAGCESSSTPNSIGPDNDANPVFKKASSSEATTVVVTAADLANDFADVVANPSAWLFYNDEIDAINSGLGSFVSNPGSATGSGSVQISVTGAQRRNLTTYGFSGTPLSGITAFAFSTYNPSAGNGGSATRSAYVNFNVDFDGTDSWQRRLVYVPRTNGIVVQDSWQVWDLLDGGNALWTHSGATWPNTLDSGSTPKTWAQILSDYPGVRVRVSDSHLGIRVGEPYASGYTENIDRFVFGTDAGTTIFDFEPTLGPPTDKRECKQGGWQQFNAPSFRNQGDCVSFVAAGK